MPYLSESAVELLRELVQRVGAVENHLAALRAGVATGADAALAPPHRRVLDLLAEVYKADESFTSSELLVLASQRLAARVPLRQALQDLCGMDARRLGIALRQIADSRAVADGVRLEAIKAEAGSRVWVLRGIEGIESPSVLRHAPAPCASCKTSSQGPRSA